MGRGRGKGIEENSKVIQASFSMQVTSSTKKEAWQKITIMVSERSSFLIKKKLSQCTKTVKNKDSVEED